MSSQKIFTPKISEAGFTMVEMLVVIGIFVFVAGLGLFLSTTTLRNSSFSSDVDGVAATLQRARGRAATNINESSHGVYLDASGYVIFQGTSYSPSDPMNQSIPAGTGFSFLFSPPLPSQAIVFSQLSGDSDYEGTISITNGTNTAVININNEGQISW